MSFKAICNVFDFFSLGIDENSFLESTHNENYYRKCAVHITGVDDLSTNEVFDYFNEYKPYCIEWINDSSCNVVWRDYKLAALALIEASSPFIESVNDQSIIDEAIEKKKDDDDVEDDDDVFEANNKAFKLEGKWRICNLKNKLNNNTIYMRYARINDKKVRGAEQRSKYYVKHGNPNYGNIKGLISNSKRTKLRAKLLNKFDDNDDDANNSGMLGFYG